MVSSIIFRKLKTGELEHFRLEKPKKLDIFKLTPAEDLFYFKMQQLLMYLMGLAGNPHNQVEPKNK